MDKSPLVCRDLVIEHIVEDNDLLVDALQFVEKLRMHAFLLRQVDGVPHVFGQGPVAGILV